MAAADLVQQGAPLTPALERALFHGSSIGGARPKALIVEPDRKHIAKFSAQADIFNVVKAEYVAMRLAALAGLDVAPVRLKAVAGRDVLLVERFDRARVAAGWTRRAMVSALTLFGLDEMMARYASYQDLCTLIRHRFARPIPTLRELFDRLVFNILVGNTDDHARNHAAFWNGETLSLTPAYDICPQSREGNEASQAMLITGQDRRSQLAVCRLTAKDFLHSPAEADDRIAAIATAIRDAWPGVCDEAEFGGGRPQPDVGPPDLQSLRVRGPAGAPCGAGRAVTVRPLRASAPRNGRAPGARRPGGRRGCRSRPGALGRPRARRS